MIYVGERRTKTYVGKVCTKHPELKGVRWASGHCVQCLRNRARLWRQTKPEKNRAKSSRYSKTPQGQKAHRKTQARYASSPTGRPNEYAKGARRRARKLNQAPALTAAEHLRINALYAEAARRTAETGIVHHVDHDKPLALGGVHHPDNMLVVPASINLAKGARYASTWDFISS